MMLPRHRRLDLLVILACLLVAIGAARLDAPSRDALPRAARVRLAWETVSREAMRHGQPPLWNPDYFGGQPLIGNPDAAALYPPSVLLRAFALRYFVTLGFVLHAWVLGAGTFLLVRRAGESRITGTLVALAAMAAGALAGRAFSASPDLADVAWLPLLAVAALAGSDRLTRWPPPMLVVLLGTVLLGGSVRADWCAVGTVVACYAWSLAWPAREPGARGRLLVQCGAALLLAAGATAFHTFPEWWMDAKVRSGELAYLASPPDDRYPAPTADLRRLLASIGRHKTVSTCGAVTMADLVNAGVPTVDGLSLYAPAYARFVSLASGVYPAKDNKYEGIATIGTPAARADLSAWLGVEYLVACEPPDSADWRAVEQAGAIGLYRSTRAPLAPAWTCAPAAATLDELEFELATRTYDRDLTLTGRRVLVHVRWASDVTDVQRQQAEAGLKLVPLRFIGERTWQYALEDQTTENIRALVTNPFVEDTAHISRALEAVGPPRPAATGQTKSELVVGTAPCPAAGSISVRRSNTYRGRTVMQVSAPDNRGIVVLPQTFIPGIRAWVDGHRVEPLRVNLAFVGVPVPAGTHRVEVAYLPAVQVAGAGVSMVFVLAFAGAGWRSRFRR